MANFSRTLQKLQPYKGPSEYVTDKYSPEDMYKEVSDASEQLSPEDVAKIHNAESTMGQNQQNEHSSASGNFHMIDSTRNRTLNELKDQGIDELPINPDRRDALLMKALINRNENSLLNSSNGPKEPTLENLYLAHKYGTSGALNALNTPYKEESKAKFKSVKANLEKAQPKKKKTQDGAKDLLDLLKED
jgi:hypothetical protein